MTIDSRVWSMTAAPLGAWPKRPEPLWQAVGHREEKIVISIDLATLVASVVIALLGNGLLGNYLLQRLRNQQDQALARLKAEQDADVKRLQAVPERTVFVHRAQFETEFAAMKTIWERVIAARGTMASLRPTASTVPEDETKEPALERFFARRKAFQQALGELKDAVFNSEPFLWEALYRELFDRLLLAASAEDLSVRIHKPSEPNWYDTGEKNLGNFMTSANTVASLIRMRIASLALLPAST